MRRLVVLNGLLALACFGLSGREAVRNGLEGSALSWGYVGLSWATLAALYGFRGLGQPVESWLVRWPTSWLLRVLLWPYCVLGYAILWLVREPAGQGPLSELAPGFWVGRLPSHDSIRRGGIDAVLCLCWEFSGLSRLAAEKAAFACVPILDGAPPPPEQFEIATEQVAAWQAQGRTILVHCAQGHGRTATIAAAALLRLGLARDVDEALARIRAVRSGARPSAAQRESLDRWAASRHLDHHLPAALGHEL